MESALKGCLPVLSFFRKTIFLCLILISVQANAAKWDLMVIAPHPDDETLCCAGIIMQALKKGKSVGVVVLTNGDGYPLAASHISGVDMTELTPSHFVGLAKKRQQWVEQSLALVNFPRNDLLFLGYPDGGLANMYQAKAGEVYWQRLTDKKATYHAHVLDYRTAETGKPAPYRRTAMLKDLVGLIERYKPDTIYVTDEADSHGDHKAAYWYIKDAAAKTQFKGKIHTYLIHNGEGHSWPYPHKLDLSAQYQQHEVNGQQVPVGINWPPHIRVPLTTQQARKKLKMINQFEAEIDLSKDYMQAFAKSEEIFWQVIFK